MCTKIGKDFFKKIKNTNFKKKYLQKRNRKC